MGSSRGPNYPSPSPIKDATHGLEQKVAETEQATQELLALRHADKRLTDQFTKAALIAQGEVAIGQNNEIISPVTDQSAVDRKTSRQNQAVSGALSILISTLWTGYFGRDIDPVILGSVIVLIMAIGQAVPTLINNREAK